MGKLLLELNLMKTWKPYGVNITIQAPGSEKQYCGVQKLVDKYQSRIDQAAVDYNRTKDENKKLWYELIRKADNGFIILTTDLSSVP